MTVSDGFDLLHEGVKRWVWKQGWASLREIQERAIAPILAANRDLVISASTAAGKTEAAFLPACSKLASESPLGVGILCFSPLKALINDQYRRLQNLAESIDVTLTPWHGDSLRSLKDIQRKSPGGILLITPESFESLLLNSAGWCNAAFANLLYIIIDEYHAFLGTERGCQLQSLMHRLEFQLKRNVPRIALSATLGDLETVGQNLRPGNTYPFEIIETTGAHSDLKLQLRGYQEAAHPDHETDDEDCEGPETGVAEDLFRLLRGTSNLVFANSRSNTEKLTAELSDRCEQASLPNEFFPHHGSLAKDLRQSVEARLNQETLPTTAICTTTLELGIDIGNVDSIAQVSAPPSVASMRQRLGRSGRRGQPSVLRIFITEEEVTVRSAVTDRLRWETFESVAMVNLLLNKWYEPPQPDAYHFSTLVQQTLSVIGQYGGVRADRLWRLLCDAGPFSLVDQSLFREFLISLGSHELITQMQDGQLVLGAKGERVVEHYTFYSAFQTPEEFRLEFEGRTLGTLPIDYPITMGQLLIFAGRRWEIELIDAEKKVIKLKRAYRGQPPRFGGGGRSIHNLVRQEMLRIYGGGEVPVYLDTRARSFFAEGVDCFRNLNMTGRNLIESGEDTLVFSWRGDRTVNALTALLRSRGLSANCFAGVIEIGRCEVDQVRQTILDARKGTPPKAHELAEYVANIQSEKHDKFLTPALLKLGFGVRYFDVADAWEWLVRFDSAA